MTKNRVAFIPLITEECLNVVAESREDTSYFIERIDTLREEQPILFQKLVDSAHSITIQIVEDTESDEYQHIFVNLLAIAVQTYMSVDKQLGIDFMERTFGTES